MKPHEPSRLHAKAARRRPARFDLIGGDISLDFVNTLDDRHTHPRELLTSYADLARFAEDVGLLTQRQSEELSERSQRSPEGAQDALHRARELREAIHDVFWAIMNRRRAPAAALARLNADVHQAGKRLSLVQANSGFEWRFDAMDGFDSVLWPLARSAADLLASDRLPLVRACSSKQCEWFFLDTSKNHQRRWCDMSRCGNRAKARSFYARQKKSE